MATEIKSETNLTSIKAGDTFNYTSIKSGRRTHLNQLDPPDPHDKKSEGVDTMADYFVASAEGESQPKTLQSRVRC